MVDEALASQPQHHLREFNLITQLGIALEFLCALCENRPQFPLRLIPGFTK